MRITHLEVQNIGPFSDLRLAFENKPKEFEKKAEINILTGENGTGKSTLLLILASFFDATNDYSLKERVRNISNLNESNFRIFFSLSFNSDLEYKYLSFEDGFSFSFSFPMISQNFSNLRYIQRIKDLNHVPNAFFAYAGYRTTRGDGYVSIKEIISNPFENATNFLKEIDSSLILDWVANIITKELISKRKGKDVNSINAVQRIEKALSLITGKKIVFDLEENLQVSIRINDVSLTFNTLPDGLKSIISWLSDLLMRLDRINWADKSKSILEQNFILFLDEIEVHLHPAWQRKILPVVQDLFPNAQIFISTHSPFVVGSVDGAWVYNFKLDENNNSYLEKEPYLTEDGHSYDRILEETFGIKERFGVAVQAQLEKFREYKNKILAGENVDNEAFMKLAKEIADQSIELNSTIGFEIRQIERITKKTLETV